MAPAKSSDPVNVDLSAILNMVGDFASIQKTVRHLCSQTIRDRLEIVIITTPDKVPLALNAVLDRAGAWQVVTIPEMPTAAAGWVAGIHQARAPVIVMCEDHSFPELNWAEALLDSHREHCAAVAPVVSNANPRSLISWANFLLCFLDWYSPEQHNGPVPAGPGHNTSYKRSVLLEYKDLEEWLSSERVLHFDFAAKGRTILLNTRAATNHVNISLPGSYLAQSFLGGRLFGASRAAKWSRMKAVIYALGFPLAAAIRLSRILKVLNRRGKRQESRFFAALPWILAGLVCHALGEALGYLGGVGNVRQRYMDFETRRSEHVNEHDRRILEDSLPDNAKTLRQFPAKV
jgi:hypothetical protein